MAVLKQAFTNKIFDFIDSVIARGMVEVDGELVAYEISYTTRDKETIRKYMRIATDVGNVTSAQLLAADGAVLAEKPFYIGKTADGILIAFEIKVYAR